MSLINIFVTLLHIIKKVDNNITKTELTDLLGEPDLKTQIDYNQYKNAFGKSERIERLLLQSTVNEIDLWKYELYFEGNSIINLITGPFLLTIPWWWPYKFDFNTFDYFFVFVEETFITIQHPRNTSMINQSF